MRICPNLSTCFRLILIFFLSPMNGISQALTTNDLMGKSTPEFLGVAHKLRKDAHHAFRQLCDAAAQDNIHIKVVSSYRDYAHQNRIWERKYKKYSAQGLSPQDAIQKIIEYSTIPGTSRHHWGTDIDLVDDNAPQPKDVLLAKHFHGDGPFCKFKEWMDLHAKDFGFYLVYTASKDRKGFKYEPWHYSYAPLSVPMLKAYQKLDLKKTLQQQQLLGSAYFSTEFINAYIAENIMDINPELLPK